MKSLTSESIGMLARILLVKRSRGLFGSLIGYPGETKTTPNLLPIIPPVIQQNKLFSFPKVIE